MSSDQLTTVQTEIPRDRFGRPLVIPPDGGKPVAYTRCTTFIDCLDDRFNLELWKIRQTAIGLADRPALLMGVTAARNNKKELDKLCAKALEAAKSSDGATTGTAIHTLTEFVDRGVELPTISAAVRADLDAYQVATAPLKVISVEQFGVHDELRVAGSWDRIYDYKGRRILGDLKTGSTIDFSLGKIAMQLSLYSRCQFYDPVTGGRTPLNVDQNNGLIVHLPASTGQCQIHWVDLKAGWEGVMLAKQVREWRRRKGFTVPFGGTA